MGSYRLVLSIIVLLGHMGISYHGHAQGVSAVVCFFLLSGYVMTGLVQKNYHSIDRILSFYLDRLLRLYPQYLLYLFFTVIAILAFHIKIPFIKHFTLFGVLVNAVTVPIGLYSWKIGDAMLIPQAGTIGLEFMFYITLPFLLIYRKEYISFIGSIAIFSLAYLGIIDTDTWGYRELPGTLFIFLCGGFMYRYQKATNAAVIALTYAMAILMFSALNKFQILQVIWNYDVLIGILVGIPALAVLSLLKFGAWDDLMGSLSYGVYLNHSLVIWSCEAFHVDLSQLSNQCATIAGSIGLAFCSYLLVERPAMNYRRKIRARSQDGQGKKIKSQSGLGVALEKI